MESKINDLNKFCLRNQVSDFHIGLRGGELGACDDSNLTLGCNQLKKLQSAQYLVDKGHRHLLHDST